MQPTRPLSSVAMTVSINHRISFVYACVSHPRQYYIIYDKIKSNKINGKIFLELSENDLKEIISLLGERKAIKAVIDSFKPSGNKVVS